MVSVIKIFVSVVMTTSLAGAYGAEETKDYWSNSTWSSPDRGFLWYGAPPATKKPPKEQKKRPQDMTNKELGAELERLLDVSVTQQTPEAVKAYLYLQQYAMDRAGRFSDVFRRTVWETPELDYSLRARPTNAMAIASYDQSRAKKQTNASEELGKTHGLFFFFRGDCPYCHQLAPILQMYQRNYGVEVFAVSLDGSTLPQFPNARPDNGAASKLNVSTVPAVFLGDKQSGAIRPIGYGIMSLDEIVNRVYVLTQTTPGQEY